MTLGSITATKLDSEHVPFYRAKHEAIRVSHLIS